MTRTALGCQKDTRIVKLELFDNADFGATTWTEVLRLTEKGAQLRTYSRNGTEIKFIDRWVPKASVAMVNGKLEIHATTWQRACGDAPRRETANNRIMQDQKDEDLAKAPRAAEKKYYEEERRKRDDRARATAISKQTSSPIAVLVRGFDDDEVEVRNWSTRQGNATRPVIMKIILKDGKETVTRR